MSCKFDINSLCRCCHAQGNFKSLNVWTAENIQDDYCVLLKDTFDIIISPVPQDIGVSYNICGICEPRLRDAALFKKQVLSCEDKLKQYLYNNCQLKDEAVLEKEVKKELGQDGCKIETLTHSDEKLDTQCSDIKLQHFDKFLQAEDDDQPLSTLCNPKAVEYEPPELHDDPGVEDVDWRTRDLSDEEELREKKTKSKKYSCEICQKKFSYNGSLEVHMKVHSGEKSFTCHLCNTSHTDNKELTKHITITHIVDNRYPCEAECPMIRDTDSAV
ncbi:unnamed protein product [Arctia plantaginis]|uniref:C2H2-type domain-containing protein n=1 Tax=Arctia plantaginis TaxID=874455 RepID=A0A8S0ZQA0_ARCPL|nr:unnamed protein product [Arctia plantaginis]